MDKITNKIKEDCKMKINKLVKERIQDLKKDIDRVKLLSPAANAVEKIFPKGHIWLHTYTARVGVSWNVKGLQDVKDALKLFAQNGIMLKEFQKSDTSPRWDLELNGVTISLEPYFPDEGTEGATCKLVKVGEQTYTNPIYKLVCDGSAEDVK
jgi:hypothetical protein